MKIFSFVKSLLEHFNKDQVLEDARTTKSELSDIAIPTFRSASDFFRSNKFNSKAVKDLQDEFYLKFERNGIPKQTNFISEIEKRLPNLLQNITSLEDEVESTFERVVIKDGLTARKAIILRGAEHISFLSRMCLDVLNYVYTMETREAGIKNDLEDSDSELSPAEIKHVEKNIRMFSTLLSDYGADNKDFIKTLNSVPELNMNSTAMSTIGSVFDEKTVDPFKAAYMPGFIGNPIYHLRLIVVEWQAARYEANKNMKKMLELRLLHLEMVNEKKFDPKVEKEIEYTRDRVVKITRYLREVEASVDAEV